MSCQRVQNQRLFNDEAVLSLNKVSLTDSKLITQAEVLEALKCVESNRYFASGYGDSERFKKCFLTQLLQRDITKVRQR